jgi:hypothetical protein
MRGVKKENLPTKVCVVCERPFTWRKKWERCWDEVTTCSKSCNASRKREKNGQSGGDGGREAGADAAAEDDDGDDDDEDGEGGEDAGVASDGGGGRGGRDARREQRKAAKKTVKATKRAKRGGSGGDDDELDGDSAANAAAAARADDSGKKPCDGCDKRVDLLIRCRVDESKRWKMLCGGKCWKDASGGVPDGDADHPNYLYGGLWKNRRAARHVSTAVPDLSDKPAVELALAEEEELNVNRKLAELELA